MRPCAQYAPHREVFARPGTSRSPGTPAHPELSLTDGIIAEQPPPFNGSNDPLKALAGIATAPYGILIRKQSFEGNLLRTAHRSP